MRAKKYLFLTTFNSRNNWTYSRTALKFEVKVIVAKALRQLKPGLNTC